MNFYFNDKEDPSLGIITRMREEREEWDRQHPLKIEPKVTHRELFREFPKLTIAMWVCAVSFYVFIIWLCGGFGSASK